jgi:hypothetical protein
MKLDFTCPLVGGGAVGSTTGFLAKDRRREAPTSNLGLLACQLYTADFSFSLSESSTSLQKVKKINYLPAIYLKIQIKILFFNTTINYHTLEKGFFLPSVNSALYF